MKLLTKDILKNLPPLYSQEKNPDPTVWVKFFVPWGRWTWYATEYDPTERRFFGYVVGDENELGYFSLDELESIKGPMGLGIERDMHFKPTKLSDVKAGWERKSPMQIVKTPNPVPPTKTAPAQTASPAPAKPGVTPITGKQLAVSWEWDGVAILKECYEALTESNYHREAKIVQALIRKLEAPPTTVSPVSLKVVDYEFIATSLSNDENTSDEDLVKLYMEEGLDEWRAKKAVSLRNKFIVVPGGEFQGSMEQAVDILRKAGI